MPHPRAAQVARLARHSRHRPVVYCLAPSGHSVERGRTADGVEIVRMPRSLPARILESLFKERRGILQDYDVRYLWWRKAARVLAYEVSCNDVLVTFGQPMVDHLAGLQIKRATGVRWIAHFSDPWADNPYDPNAAAHRASEAAVLEDADSVIYTTEDTVDLVYAKYPAGWRDKVEVLPHSFEQRLYGASQPSPHGIVIRYLGNLFPGRGPEPLLAGIAAAVRMSPAKMANVRFELIGDAPRSVAELTDARELAKTGLVRFLPRVAYAKSLELMAESDLLLNIDAPAAISVFLPSKLVDYIGSGRPILSITPPGTSANLVSSLGGWVAHPGKPDVIGSQLLAAIDTVRQKPKTWGRQDVRFSYEATAVAARFDSIVDRVSGH